VVGTTFGFAVFLCFVLFAVNLAVGLYARSTATAVTFDQTRRLAEQGAGCSDGVDSTRNEVSQRLGRWWQRVQVAATCDGDVATVRVDATSSLSLVPASLLRRSRLSELHRTFTVRIETPR